MARRDIILAAIAEVCADKGCNSSSISEKDVMGAQGLGLDSLDMATIVAKLDATLNMDPFAQGFPSFHTVEDFICLYETREKK